MQRDQGYPHNRLGGNIETRASVFFFNFILLYFFYLKGKRNRDSKNKNARTKIKQNQNYIQKVENEFTLKEYPGRVDLPSPHYSLEDRNARGMALGVDH